MGTWSSWPRWVYAVAAANVLILLFCGQYDVHVGPLHLFSHGLFKPLQLTMAAFWLAFWTCRQGETKVIERPRELAVATIAAVLIGVFVHARFAFINFQNPYWTHTEASSRITSLASLGNLFVTPQEDGFYRPWTFISLLADYRLFGSYWPGYHIQSILLHAINILLLGYLARKLELGVRVAGLACLLFAAAPITFEAVLWPAARFDLWATAFILSTLIVSLSILRDGSLSYAKIVAVAILYACGLLNKESTYSVPLLVLLLLLTRSAWGIARAARRNVWTLLITLAAVTACLLTVRLRIYHGLGGYTLPDGSSAHVHFTWRTAESTVTRLMAVAPITANLSTGVTLLLGIGLILLIAGYGSLLFTSGRDRINIALLGCAFVTLLPAANVVGWVHEDAQQSRYLYTPGLFLMLLFARLVSRSRTPGLSMAALMLGGILITWSNLSIYEHMLELTGTLADRTAREAIAAHVPRIAITGLPSEPNGVFFFRDELRRDIEARLGPGSFIVPPSPFPSSEVLLLRWDPELRTLHGIDAGRSGDR